MVHRCALGSHWQDVLKQAPDLAALANILGHQPADPALFVRALTHGSMGEAQDYQRLEFLGDRVLGLVIGSALFERFPDISEGQLSSFLNRLVSGESCADVARTLALGPHIRLGKQARDDGGAHSANILGDVVESLIGALYLDHGLSAAQQFILHQWDAKIAAIDQAPQHPKSALQEWAAAHNRKMPEYALVGKSGPHHDLRFTVSVAIKGVGDKQAEGSSKQEAETLAAKLFLEEFCQ